MEQTLRYVSKLEIENFRDVMQTYGQDIWNYAYFLTGSTDLADEISQDTFIKAFYNIEKFRGECSIRTWLIKIARNLAYDYKRKNFLKKVIFVRKGDGVTSKSITTITDGSTRLEVYSGKSEVNYRKEAINNQSSLINTPKTRFYKDKNGDMNWITRGDVASAYDKVEMVFPQNYAFWTIDEQSLLPNYTILGKETIAGREAMVLIGLLNTYVAEKQHASFYQYWVESKTGVMLKMNLLDKDNNPVFKMEMEKIVFDNETIDHSKFSTQPKQDWVELNNKKNERSP
ncbi:sigma-70 family RNA polymerase sigma factor [Paenibacillus sp. OAS669]|uniref:sigma-70 family RNA polymerase sigma factor n=1 Tax=Paenibacillus sp. OAS669 TaxID=2663821 RepID=UPI00178A0A72|nr:sigma-70 family RNA polymerase sigma factor [Paenibacillus sp. OAS669]MBE1442573.1 RNA polymerase sigma factor (sigma-70 family) [Paenibacillus sp. OAS669]